MLFCPPELLLYLTLAINLACSLTSCRSPLKKSSHLMRLPLIIPSPHLSCFFFFFFWLCWVFVSVWGLSLVVASGGHSSSRCAGLSLSRPLLLRSTGSRRAGSVIVAHGPSCTAACGIFPDQGSNPCPLHWQADSQPLRHQGSPILFYFFHRNHSNQIPLHVCLLSLFSQKVQYKQGLSLSSIYCIQKT